MPSGRAGEVEAWTVAHHSLADYFIDSVGDDQISIEEATEFQQRSLELASIEQDSDIVMFLYRDEVYNEATEFPNQADILVSKHRNGPTGVIQLYFEKRLTKFMDASVHKVDLSDLE